MRSFCFLSWRFWLQVWVVAAGCAGAGSAQIPRDVAVAQPADAVSSGAAVVLRSMGARAGVIFSGTVTTVDREDAAGFVDVSFRVEQAVRGCAAGGTYVLREWAGLWAAGPERYRVGDRRLMLLHGRGASGMSSPVDGMMGAVPLVASAEPPLLYGGRVPPPDLPSGSAGSAEPVVDVRWVEAAAVRGLGAAAASIHDEVAPVVWPGPILPLTGRRMLPGGRVAGPRLAAVLALLGGAQGAGAPGKAPR